MGRDFVPRGVERRTGLWPTLKRTVQEFQEDNLTDWAATLTYYGLLALFPALIVLVSIVGLVGDPESTTNTLTDIVTRLGPDSAAGTFEGPIRQVTESRGTAGFVLITSTLVALWSASGYLGAFIRASNVIYETREGRPFWKLRPLQLLLTLVPVLLLAVMVGVIYYASPNVKQRGFKWITPGGIVALLVWLLASAGFGLYVSQFG